MVAWGLTPEEDAELRRLHFMLRFGAVALRFTQRYTELRRRDRRVDVREPDDEALAVPVHQVDDDVDDGAEGWPTAAAG